MANLAKDKMKMFKCQVFDGKRFISDSFYEIGNRFSILYIILSVFSTDPIYHICSSPLGDS